MGVIARFEMTHSKTIQRRALCRRFCFDIIFKQFCSLAVVARFVIRLALNAFSLVGKF